MQDTLPVSRATSIACTRFCYQCLAFVCIALCAGVAAGQITLDASFDHGGLDEFNSFVRRNVVTLAGRDNYNTSQWKWLYFSADNVGGEQPIFRIDDNFVGGGSNLDQHKMVYSYDQENWLYFDNHTLMNGMGDNSYSFSNNNPFTQNQVYVAYGLPYSYGDVVSHVSEIASSPWVMPTTSSDSSLVIGQSPGGIDDLGRIVSPKDIYGFKVTDPSVAGTKKKIALVSGVHSNETLGNHTLEGLVDFLLSNAPEAASLRNEAEFYIYPMANPDGRFAGYNRSTVEQVDKDPNRFWETPNYGGMSDIKIVGDSLIADTEGEVDFFIDFHSTVSGKSGHYGIVHPDFQNNLFWQYVQQLEPSLTTRNATFKDLTSQRFALYELNAKFTMTFETEFIGDESIDRYHDLGKNFALALEQAPRLFADLNFDDSLDYKDWQMFIAGMEADLSSLSLVEAYQAGDLDGDGMNSFSDLGVFKEAYIALNGQSSFLALFVPEPSSFYLTTTALAGCRRRNRVV